MKNKPIKIPYAIGSFEKLREEGFYFIDKTQFIPELEKYQIPTFLRPRRFGKSLWCSVLEAYYDINTKDKFESLFGDLYIGQNPTETRNSYMVLRFDFSTISVKPDIKYIENSFYNINYPILKGFVDASYKRYFVDKGYVLPETKSIADILNSICSFIKTQNLPPLYIIIDEYDNFTNQLVTTRNDKLYKDLTTSDSFFKTFFKVIKSASQMQIVGKVFITGVLPITADDLTSGFNIAELITLKKHTLNMLGFTQKEVEKYVDDIFTQNNYDKSKISEVLDKLRSYYNGYKFLPDTNEPLYNSTIVTYYLKSLVLDNGELPKRFIDDNLRTDVNWVRRLANTETKIKEMLETIMFDKQLPYDGDMLVSKFNMNQFFEKDFYPVSLFYLGMMTIKDNFYMQLPNQTMKKIFAEYFNTIEDIEASKGYTEIFRGFMEDLDIGKMFQGYWDVYIKQLPAQIFDKVNENFYRTTFYELCTRYLFHSFTFMIEVNRQSGRTDLEIQGRHETKYANKKFLVEFKYFSNKKAKEKKIMNLKAPYEPDITQIKTYEKDIMTEFPNLKIESYIIYLAGNKGFNCIKVE